MRSLLVRLKGRGVFRAGGIKGDRDVEKTVRSDTIFSAIVQKAFLLYNEEIALSLAESLRVSSMVYEKEGKLYVFAPKYLKLNPNRSKSKDESDVKKVKKTEFIPLEKLKDWLLGEFGVESNGGVKTIMRPRVGIDRVHSATNLYFVRGLYFEGTPCFIALVDDGFEGVFKASVKLLGDEGLGGDRTYGMGLFKPEFSEFSNLPKWLVLDGSADMWITMSLYRPAKDEIEKITPENSWYKLVEKGGWIHGSGIRKPRVVYFEEGSTFRFRPVGENLLLRISNVSFIVPGKPVSLGVMLND